MTSPTVGDIIDRLADVAQALVKLFDALLQWNVASSTLKVSINNQEPTGMTIPIPDDKTFTIHVVAVDKFGDPATEAGTFSITASNPSLCDVKPDDAGHPGDSSWALGTPLAGAGQFVINAMDTGGLKGASDELDIMPGAPAVLQIDINAA